MNKVLLIGRLTRDPEVRYSTLQNGDTMAIARYTLAIDRAGKNKEADFPSCVAFGKQGEFAEKYLHKGVKIAVEGRLQTGSYEKDGVKHYTTDVVVERHEFCEAKGSEAPQSAPDNGFINVPDDAVNDLPFK